MGGLRRAEPLRSADGDPDPGSGRSRWLPGRESDPEAALLLHSDIRSRLRLGLNGGVLVKGTARSFACLLLALAPCAVAGEDAGCVYLPRATAAAQPTEGPEPTIFANCGSEKDDGTAVIRPEHLAAVDFGADGLAVVRVGEHFYYFRPDGRSARVPTWDNWADDFVEGLVRTVRTVDGVEKLGYLDRELAVVIAPRFDWGFPFSGGRAMVCNGCRAEAPDGDEHGSVIGGLWGYVDKAGKEVVPIRFSYEELLKRVDRP